MVLDLETLSFHVPSEVSAPNIHVAVITVTKASFAASLCIVLYHFQKVLTLLPARNAPVGWINQPG